MVSVFVPQIVTTSCDDCTFLRNDPLGNPAAVKRFTDLLWESRPRFGSYGRQTGVGHTVEHAYMSEVRRYVTYTYPPR